MLLQKLPLTFPKNLPRLQIYFSLTIYVGQSYLLASSLYADDTVLYHCMWGFFHSLQERLSSLTCSKCFYSFWSVSLPHFISPWFMLLLLHLMC